MPSCPDPRQFACALLDSFDFRLRRALKTPHADQVHDLRVAARRFTQALVIFESCLGGARVIRKELKILMTLSGRVRDFDIVLEFLEGSGTKAPKTLKTIERKRAKAERGLAGAHGEIVERDAIGKWRGKLKSPHRKAAARVRGGVKQSVLRAGERFFDRGARAYEVKDSSEHLHPLRIATKELRYTLELATQPGGARKHDPIEQLQSDLGDIHDLESVHEILSEYHGAKKLIGRLEQKQRKRIRKFRDYWKSEFGGAKNRAGWMRRITACADSLLASAGLLK